MCCGHCLSCLYLEYIKKIELGLYEQQNKELKNRLSVDIVTGAHTRVYGERKLEAAFKSFLEGENNTFIAVIDVDHFKSFNDKYGHKVGDEVLKAVVKVMKECTRTSDDVMRWGGDEFIIAFKDLSETMAPVLGDKILSGVRSIDLSEFGVMDSITLSIGFAKFDENDKSYNDALGRADVSLYSSKEKGRNCFSIQDENE